MPAGDVLTLEEIREQKRKRLAGDGDDACKRSRDADDACKRSRDADDACKRSQDADEEEAAKLRATLMKKLAAKKRASPADDANATDAPAASRDARTPEGQDAPPTPEGEASAGVGAADTAPSPPTSGPDSSRAATVASPCTEVQPADPAATTATTAASEPLQPQQQPQSQVSGADVVMRKLVGASVDSPVHAQSPALISSPQHVPSVPAAEEPPVVETYYPALSGCRSVNVYEKMNRVEEGSYGVVFRVRDKATKDVYALKKLKMEQKQQGFPITALREINTLVKAKHENICQVREIVVGDVMDDIFIVMEFVEHDLKGLLEDMKQPLLQAEVKTLMIQLLRGVRHLHDNWMFHRDLKTSNLLLSHRGILKIADFGLAREFGSPLKQYSTNVVTLWYRCPSLLLGATEYTTALDMWSVGAIFAELVTRKPLFPGKGELDQLQLIFKKLGTPNDKIWQGFSDLPSCRKVTFAQQPHNHLRKEFGAILSANGLDLLQALLTYDPNKRESAHGALRNEWFREYPPPTDPELFPHWPARAEGSKRKHTPEAPRGGGGNPLNRQEEELARLIGDGTQHTREVAAFSLRF